MGVQTLLVDDRPELQSTGNLMGWEPGALVHRSGLNPRHTNISHVKTHNGNVSFISKLS